jgi:hypothetical protein
VIDVVDRAVQIPRGVGVQICEWRILLAGLVVGQRVIHDRVLGDFRQRDVPAHVVQVRPVVLAHDEKLTLLPNTAERMRLCFNRAYC